MTSGVLCKRRVGKIGGFRGQRLGDLINAIDSNLLIAAASELAGQNSFLNSDLKSSQSRNLVHPTLSSSYLKMRAAHLAALPVFMYESDQMIFVWSSEKESGQRQM